MQYRFGPAAQNRVPLDERLDDQHQHHQRQNNGDAGSSRWLKISRWVSTIFAAELPGRHLRGQHIRVGNKPDARIGVENLLVTRVMVMITSHAIGTSVTQIHRKRPFSAK